MSGRGGGCGCKDRAADARGSLAGATASSWSAEGDGERARRWRRMSSIDNYGGAAEPEVDADFTSLDGRRLALRAAVIDLLLAQGSWLVDEGGDDRAAREDALMMAIWRRGKPGRVAARLGSGQPYTSEQFAPDGRDGIECSMSRSGNVWDNAAMESFFSSLKTEQIGRNVYRSRDEAEPTCSTTSSGSTTRCAGIRPSGSQPG